MEIKAFDDGIYGATTYLCYDKTSLDAAIIDCTCSIDEIKAEIKEKKLNLKYILITHGHFDHVYCLKEAKLAFPMTPVLMNENDLELLNQVPIQCSMAGVEGIEVPCIDKFVDETTDLKLGNTKIQVITTSGHSKGGVCYLIGDVLFSGDTLFLGSIGRYDLFGGSYSEIEQSIRGKLFKLADNIVVYPGHGPKTTIGKEKHSNPYFKV